jgi:RND family efflux transporter MFP subunit
MHVITHHKNLTHGFVGLLESELKYVASVVDPAITARLAVLLCCGLATALVGCKNNASTTPQSAQAPASIELAAADVVTAEKRTLQPSIAISGTLQALHSTTVQPQSAAIVLSVLADDGDQVQQGQALVTLNTQDSQSRLAQAQANLAAASAQLILARSVRDRNGALYKKGFVSQLEYERSTADANAQQESVNAQTALVAISQKAVNDAVIRAPMSGVVSSRRVEAGQTVSAGQTLMDIIDPTVMELKGTAPTQAQPFIQEGQTIRFNIQGLPQQSFEGQIHRINPQIDPASRTLVFYARVNNSQRLLRAGLFAEGVLQHGKAQQGVALPQQAIQGADKPFVWVIRNQKLTRQPTQLISQDPVSGWALVSDIQAGETIAKLSLAEGAQGRTAHITK